MQMARTQRNKATEAHLGLLKAKLAKLRRELLTPVATKSGGGEGFDVTKAGDARVGLIGFPSVGKSTLLNKLTQTYSEVAAYEFTTLTCIPGVIQYKGARIQLLDLPGIIEGAKDGKGRGKQVIAVARTCNLLLIVLDSSKPLKAKLKIMVFPHLSIFQAHLFPSHALSLLALLSPRLLCTRAISSISAPFSSSTLDLTQSVSFATERA